MPLSLDLLGDTRGRSGAHFSGSKGLNPLVLSKAPFTSPHVHATFVISHNVCDLNPISRQVPGGAFDSLPPVLTGLFGLKTTLHPQHLNVRPFDRKMLSAMLACTARRLAVPDRIADSRAGEIRPIAKI